MSNEVNLSTCDREPIHTPGAIQSFGALLVVDAKTFRIVQVSANAENFFEKNVLDRSINEVLGETASVQLQSTQARIVHAHAIANVIRREGFYLLECEPNTLAQLSWYDRSPMDAMHAADSLQNLLSVTAKTVADLSGLDRVMIYRFHEDLHGEVVAEWTKPNVPSYLGLHYPASDIPQPARAVFLKNWVRMIPDVQYTAVPLLPEINPLTQSPLDLGISILRAVSPVHIEYLKNMRVGSSLTISLHVNGKLWGLIACHGLQARYLSIPIRDACEVIGRLASALIAVKMEEDINRKRRHFTLVYNELNRRLQNGGDMAVELSRFSPNLLDLISATGSAAALYLEGYWITVGESPSENDLNALVQWLTEKHSGEAVFATDALASQFPPAFDYQKVACGLLALSIPKSDQNYIFWFRPEITSVIKWAGQPEKKIDDHGQLHPRASFAEWQQKVTGHSEPWTELECETALELRNAIMAADLRKQFAKEQAARAEAERAMVAREELMAVLSHDLKNPIGSIKLSAKVATRFLVPEKIKEVKNYLDRIERATTNMDALINDVLSITKLEAGYLALAPQSEEVTEMIQEVVDIIGPIAASQDIDLQTDFKAHPCPAWCDRSRIFQVLSNIVGNAIKFTPPGGQVKIILEACDPEFVKITVRDTGPGIPPEDLKHIFDRFWQATKAKRLGTGLGLAIAKGIVEGHKGEIWAESDGVNGTEFHIKIPSRNLG